MKTTESQIIRPHTSDKEDMTHRLLLQALRVKVVFVLCCFNKICLTFQNDYLCAKVKDTTMCIRGLLVVIQDLIC